jgi:hypothetical protein
MKPLTVLLGIVLGSAVALAVSLAMTGVVFVLLPEYSARLQGERLPLFKALAWSWSIAAVAGTSFVGELRGRAWRWPAEGLLLLMLAILAWRYWPA